jgi:predicted site-specific integrase-resolvase
VEVSVASDAAQELAADMLATVACFAAGLYGSQSQQFRQKVKTAAKEAAGGA